MFLHLSVSHSVYGRGCPCMMPLLVWLTGLMFLPGVSVQGVSLTGTPPGQTSPTRDSLARDPPGQRCPWTETPLGRDPLPLGQRTPCTETPLRQRSPGQRPQPRNPLDRDLPGQRPPPPDRHPHMVKSGRSASYWNVFLFKIKRIL